MHKGIAASSGIAIGIVHVLQDEPIAVNTSLVHENDVNKELERLEQSLHLSKKQLKELHEKTANESGEENARIFEAHLMILDDDMLLDEIKNKICSERFHAEYALSQVAEVYMKMFSEMEDDYLKERAADIKDISTRVIKNLQGRSVDALANIAQEVVIVAKDLSPSDTAQMDKDKVKAFLTDIGGKTSHTAIMARSMEIPAVLGLGDITVQANKGDPVIVDGNKGIVYLNPDQETEERYRILMKEYGQYLQELKAVKELPAETRDGRRKVELAANIGTPKDCKGALENGAEGVGLFRTEFLYMDRASLPSEEEQFQAYREAAEKMAPYPVIIRTLDVGGDKQLPALEMPDEMNPFLGWRAIRLCLDRTDIFKTQLRAILRASYYGKVRIMYPMISGVKQVRQANQILDSVKTELKGEGIPFDHQVEVGIMIEIPSAALIADLLAKEVDFFSIGTNDLIQYSIAVDRMNERIAHLYDPLHPAVLRLIKNVIDESHKVGIWTGMCGEMAGDEKAVPILLGLGLDEFSMSAASILPVKKVIRSLSYQEAVEIADQAMEMADSESIKAMIQQRLSPNGTCRTESNHD
ncbi:phosphoenolpyruvate--protein phosphotransferase [Heliobacterium chlorum]|uniref:Phosphoenolpyruvate-protein phosphotransferase n=1 Tax=Heliobacterium chlorum TaxID=2698 RepID=A0ABR7T4Q7_HELCL|nr:phosphoenolpyruvate--protein phosphotransferase [Heliobacterium chlorum]MBC9785202.1 phosphoenolpyruvate--protein phosphotransferase [Heliobacterium chlorum]